jgi:hypothetical protein
VTGQARAQVRRFAARVDAATPPQRDRAVDALRALAIAGVIGGHWLVTALVPGSAGGVQVLRDTSPLAAMPALAPASWIFQTLALLLRDRLARWMRRPLAWAAAAAVNLSAMTLFLWHQTAFIAVTAAGMLGGRVPGLLTAPAGAPWIAERIAWLPVFAAMLAGLWLLLHRFEHGAARSPAERNRQSAGVSPVRPNTGSPRASSSRARRGQVPYAGT